MCSSIMPIFMASSSYPIYREETNNQIIPPMLNISEDFLHRAIS